RNGRAADPRHPKTFQAAVLHAPPLDAKVWIKREPVFLSRRYEGSGGRHRLGQIAVPNPRADAHKEGDVFQRLRLKEQVVFRTDAHIVRDMVQRLDVAAVVHGAAGVIDAAAEELRAEALAVKTPLIAERHQRSIFIDHVLAEESLVPVKVIDARV